MSNCCGEYHMADCPIQTGYRDTYERVWEEFNDTFYDNEPPEPIDPANCEHGDTNGTEINGEVIMVCIHCETHVNKVIPCSNPGCIWGKVYDPSKEYWRGRAIGEKCTNCDGLGSVFIPIEK